MVGRLRSRLRADGGAALVTVLGWTVVLTLLVTAVLTFAVNGMRQARADQDWHAALSAAEAGVDDFLYRLNQNNAFWSQTPDCDDIDPRCGYVPVPGSGSVGRYRYEVDSSLMASMGTLRVTATGQVGDRVRSVEASLRRDTFIDYIYFTDYEQVPPVFYRDNYGPAWETWARDNCVRHAHASPPPHPSCLLIRFVSGDVIDGPFRTNDSILLEGTPEWRFEAISSNPAIDNDPSYPGYNVMPPPAPTANPTFPPDQPSFDSSMRMPASNEALRDTADPGNPSGGAGCLYSGPTFVRLHDNGTMSVESPKTQGSAGPGCPGHGATGPLPGNGVLYVETSSLECGEPHPFRSGSSPLLHPDDQTSYATCAGDLFIEGTLSGQLTAGAANDIIVTWHLEYDDRDGTDLLGLAAQGDVLVFRPYCRVTGPASDPCYRGLDLPVPRHGSRFTNPRIHGALLSVTGSVRVQNVYNQATWINNQVALGNLEIYGAIIQIFRGPVGVGNPPNHLGYLKDYEYDWRLQRLSPPYFIEPVSAQFRVREWAERDPQP